MTDFELITLILSGIAILAGVPGSIVALLAYRKSRQGEKANQAYQQIQKDLAELQVAAFSPRADVRINFNVRHLPPDQREFSGRVLSFEHEVHTLIVRNTGNAEARNIHLSFRSEIENLSVPHELQELDTIAILAPGAEVSYGLGLGHGDSLELFGSWHWEDPDGSQKKRESQFSIPD